ncbi:ABC transporter ATP-binding protein [Rhizobiaceae bacterium BDR2-2]|uniref:ABC transporter ATP-binding protein n=1 Tax=Ectorhizobium quercum TaxID=2965071 RepID=A0AAE3SVB8_9HYPH|nr:ABC transporter ATP-binding protein [Ectorhizobium quercum]MCX8998165.1 ABC transporter ATP-binding protein [Ectorhizobium quercum]
MVLVLRSVGKRYQTAEGPLTVLKDIDLTLVAGQSLALTGESGSGKSTLLHLAAALDTPDEGSVAIAGRDVSAMSESGRAGVRRTLVGIVFQQFNLIPSLTVAANLSFHARLAGRSDPAWENRLAGRLGLTPLLGRYPEQLSGGQQQRVAIGRTLAARPPLILADEPTGNLDEANGDAVMALFLDLLRESAAALLMVTHSARLAQRLDRQVTLTGGRILA